MFSDRQACWPLSIGVLTAVLISPAPAQAHVAASGADGLFIGLLQPLFEIEAGIAAAALGLLFGQQARDDKKLAIRLFLGSLVVGLAVAFLPTHPAISLIVVHALGLIAGIVIAVAHPLGRAFYLTAGLIGGFLIGVGSIPEPAPAVAIAYTIGGSFITLALLFMYGVVGAGWIISRPNMPWLTIVLRVVGSWIAAVSLMMLAFLLR